MDTSIFSSQVTHLRLAIAIYNLTCVSVTQYHLCRHRVLHVIDNEANSKVTSRDRKFVSRDRKFQSSFQMTVESNYVIAIAALSDWLKKVASVFQPMRRKTKTNRGLYA